MSEKPKLNLDDFKLENVLDPEYKVSTEEVEAAKTVETASIPAPTAPPVTEPEEEEEEVLPEKAGQPETPEEVPDHDLDLVPFYALFHEKLGWEVPKEDMPENTIEGFVNYMNSIVEQSSVPQYSNQVVADFDKFVANGGDPTRFLTTMYGSRDYEQVNLESDADKNQVLTEYLLKINPDKDKTWVDKKIERYDTAGTKDDEAADALEELKAIQAKDKASLIPKQEEARRRELQAYTERITNLETAIKSTQVIAGIPVPEKDKKGFFEFLTKPDKDGNTEYHKATQKEDAALAMAYLAYKGFDVKNLTSNVKSEVVKDLKKAMSKFSSATTGLSNKTALPVQSNKIDYKQFDIGT